MDISWPENLNGFDLILTTQTKPTDCFSPKSLASFIYNKPEYFIKNRLNGIYTADDEEVIIILNDLVNKDQKLFEKNAIADGCSTNEISDFLGSTLELQ